MVDGRIPKDLLYEKLVQVKRHTGGQHLGYKKVCEKDLKAMGIDINCCHATAIERTTWSQTVAGHLQERRVNKTKRGPPNRKRKDREGRPEAREQDQRQTTPAPSVGETVTTESA